jgi:hypothetical protein
MAHRYPSRPWQKYVRDASRTVLAVREGHSTWRFSKPNTISVARREAVARLDEFVGPKY